MGVQVDPTKTEGMVVYPSQGSAESHGASPSASAADNTSAIQTALNQTGLITLTAPGIYQVSSVLKIYSGTELALGAGVVIQAAAGLNNSLLRNACAQINVNPIYFSWGANVWTVTEASHNRQVGDQVWLENITGAGVTAGAVAVTSVTPDTWTYAGANAALTGRISVGPYHPVSGSVMTISGGFLTVTETGSSRRTGDMVYLTGFAAGTGSVNGWAEIVDVSGDAWTIATAATGAVTGTGNILGDNRITLSGPGILDGNRLNNPGNSDDRTNWVINFGNVGALTFNHLTVRSANMRCLSVFNVSDVQVANLHVSDTLVGMQFEGSLHRLTLKTMLGDSHYAGLPAGTNCDDFLAFTNTVPGVGGAYDATASPSGNGDFQGVDIDDLHSAGGADVLAIVGQMGPKSVFRAQNLFLDVPFIIGNAAGELAACNGVVRVDDDGPSLLGSYMIELDLEGIYLRSATNAPLAPVKFTHTGTIQKCSIQDLAWDGNSTQGILIQPASVGCTIDDLEIDGYFTPTPILSYGLWIGGGYNPTVNKLRFGSRINFTVGNSNAAGLLYLQGGTIGSLKFSGLLQGTSGLGQLVYYGGGTINRIDLSGLAYKIGTVINSNSGVLAAPLVVISGFHLSSCSGFIYDNPTSASPRTWTILGSGFIEDGASPIFRQGSAYLTFSVNLRDIHIVDPAQIGQNAGSPPVIEWLRNDLVQTLAYAAALTPDPNYGDVANIGPLTGNISIGTPPNPVSGKRMVLNYTQDAIGGRTVTYSGAFHSPIPAAGTASQKASHEFIFDGSSWIGGTLIWS